jgi:uncharacterized protein YbaR (Trm112 family)
MKDKVHTVTFEDELRVCPVCGYKDGFHTMLRKDGKKIHWLFICPSCHEIFDIGYREDNPLPTIP